MGFDDELDVTDDIGAADVIVASSSEMKQNPWIHSVAKYHKLPIFVVKVITRYIDFVLSTADCACININLFLYCKWQTNTMAQIVKAIRMIVGRDNRSSSKQPKVMEDEIEIEDDAPIRKPSLEEIDALEVISLPHTCL